MVKVEYEKSEYEQERDARIARNEAFMRSLGLGGGLAGPEEPKKPKKPRKKRPRGSEPREGSRKSGRIAGEIAPGFEDANAIALALAEADPNTSTVRLFRVPRGKRIHAQRSAELDSICTETNQLTAAEAAAAAAARAAFEDSNWKPESAAREGLAAVPGIRRPAWLDSLENSAILSSKPQAHVDKVMIVLERLAAGCGIGLPGWPDRARLCDAAQRPLTLGTDIEMLKYCGKRLETVHGEDTSNGWAYTHALGKLKAYQGMLMGDDVFSEESLADLDDAVLEFIVADAIKPLSLKPMTPEERAGPTSPEDDAAIAAALAEGARGTRSSTRTRTPTTKASEGDGGEEEEEEESSDDDDDDDDDGDGDNERTEIGIPAVMLSYEDGARFAKAVSDGHAASVRVFKRPVDASRGVGVTVVPGRSVHVAGRGRWGVYLNAKPGAPDDWQLYIVRTEMDDDAHFNIPEPAAYAAACRAAIWEQPRRDSHACRPESTRLHPRSVGGAMSAFGGAIADFEAAAEVAACRCPARTCFVHGPGNPG